MAFYNQTNYRLDEACELTGCTETELIFYAIEGRLRFFLTVRNEENGHQNGLLYRSPIVQVSSDHDESIDRAKVPQTERAVQKNRRLRNLKASFITLSIQDYKDLLLNGQCVQNTFGEYTESLKSFAADESTEVLWLARSPAQNVTQYSKVEYDPNKKKQDPNKINTNVIQLYQEITFEKRDLEISTREIVHFCETFLRKNIQTQLDSDLKCNQLEKLSTDKNTKKHYLHHFVRESYHTQMTVDLIQVAIHFWKKIYFQFECYPKATRITDEVKDYLMAHYDFGRRAAIAASKIIRPAYAFGVPALNLQLNAYCEMTELMRCLLAGAKHFYGNISQKYLVELPNRHDVSDWFQETYHFPTNLAHAAAILIEPTKEDLLEFDLSKIEVQGGLPLIQ